jgi:hypothetical protein
MILLSLLINRYRAELERTHGHELLPSHRQALQAMARCRQQGSDLMVLECKNCQKTIKVPHSCGHRSCPHCQHFESQQWIERQTAKLLPVPYFLLTFTVPYELRDWFWEHQRTAYDLLLRTAWLTVQAFGRRDPKLNGQMGAHAVLHTHNRRLEYHPHVHLIVPAGAVSKQQEQWRSKSGEYLFPVVNLSRVYRAKWFEGLRLLGVEISSSLPSKWVVHCKAVGRGDKALVYLGRYLYRGVLPEKNILKDQDGSITFKTVDNEGAEIIQTLPGAEFLWLLLRHVLPKRFRRVRDFGLLHGNAKAVVQLLQMLLSRIPFYPMTKAEKQPMACPECGRPMKVVAVRVREVALLRC